MPTLTIPFSLPPTARTWDKDVTASSKDQFLINGMYEYSNNSGTSSKSLYCTKRSGSSTGTTIASNLYAVTHFNQLVGELYTTTSAIYSSAGTNLGTIDNNLVTAQNFMAADSTVNSKGVVVFATASATGWYLWSDASTTNFPTFTGDTHTNTVIDNIASTTGIYPGQAISGAGIQAGTRVATITSPTAITTTIATTATASITITKEAVAKIIDSNFPGTLGFVQLNGYFFSLQPQGASGGVIWQSALNDPSSWATSDICPVDSVGDTATTISKVGNYIVVGGTNSIQFFRNTGNSIGTILSNISEAGSLNLKLITALLPVNGEYYALGSPSMVPINANSEAVGLYRLSGTTFSRITDDIVGGILVGMTGIGAADIGDKEVIVCYKSNDVANRTVVPAYDYATDNWIFISTADTLLSIFGRRFTIENQSAFRTWAASSVWQDSSVAFTMTAQTQPYALNKGKGFVINSVELLANTESSGLATLSISGDDYVTFRSPGSFDLTKTTKRVHRCGYYRNHAIFKVEDSGNNPARFQGLYVDWEPCST